MKRGDLILTALAGDFGKARPALIIQSDVFSSIDCVTILLVSSTEAGAQYGRVAVSPSEPNGLRLTSQVMVDKVMTIRRDKVRKVIGRLDAETMAQVDRSLMLFFGLA